jgi:hypothetical protein
VHSLDGAASDEAVSRLATAAGVKGDVQHQQDRIFVEDGTSVVEVYAGPGLPWSYYPSQGSGVSGSGVGGSTGEGTVTTMISGTATSDCPANAGCSTPPEPAQPAPQRPADLPSKDEATKLALELVQATGVSTDGAKVTAVDDTISWGVVIEPVVDGLRAVGYASYVSIGGAGRIESASGYLTVPKVLDAYPLLDTTAAIDRLNNGGGSFGGGPTQMGKPERGVAVDSGASSTGSGGTCKVLANGSEICESTGGGPATTIPGTAAGCVGGPAVDCAVVDPAPSPSPEETCPSDTAASDDPTKPGSGSSSSSSGRCVPPDTMPEPDPVTVTITAADRILLLVGSWDGTKAFLVPGYELTGDDGSTVTVAAVPDEFIEPPQDQSPGSGSGSGGVKTLPAPAPAPPVTGTIPPQGSQILTGLAVTLYHCGFEPVDFDGFRFVADPPPFDQTNAPAGFIGKGTVPDYSHDGFTYVDDSGAKVAFHAVDASWTAPPCA